MKGSIPRIIKEAVDKVQLIDTHKHLPQEKERTAKDIDLFEMLEFNRECANKLERNF